MVNMLEMINVSYAYKSKKEIVHVLDKVTYRFEIGEMYGIFGPSGSGKTTCLSLLAGLEKPDVCLSRSLPLLRSWHSSVPGAICCGPHWLPETVLTEHCRWL